MLKGILVFLLIAAVLAGAGLWFVSQKIRPEWVKAQILPRVEEATGARIEVGNIRLSLFPRVSVWIEDVRVASSLDADESVFRAERVEIYPRLASLLAGKVELTAVGFLKPEIRLKKAPDGRLNLPAKAAGSRDSTVAGASAPLSFLITRFILSEGSFSYSDETGAPPLRFDLSRIDAEVRDISLDRPIRFALKAAFEGPARNLEASGTYGPISAAAPDRRLTAALRLGLDQINFDDLKKKIPALAELPFSGTPAIGSVSLDVASVDFDGAGGVSGVDGEAELDLKELRLDTFKTALTGISARAVMSGDRVTIEDGRALLGGGNFGFNVSADGVFTSPGVRFKAALRNVEMNDATPLPAHPQAPLFYGKLNSDITLEGRGRNFAEAFSTVSGSGQLEIAGGLLKNVNVLASVFEKLAAIPFVGTRLQDYLSPQHRAIVFQRDMALRIAQSRFTVNRGNVRIEQVNVQGDAFLISGGGYLSPKGRIKLDGILYIGEALSREMTGLVPDLGVLADPYGRMFFPFMVVGETAHPQVIVDKEYITQKLVASKGSELLGKVLKPGKEAGNQTGNLLKGLIK